MKESGMSDEIEKFYFGYNVDKIPEQICQYIKKISIVTLWQNSI